MSTLQTIYQQLNDLKTYVDTKNKVESQSLTDAIMKMKTGSSGRYEMTFPEDVVAVNIKLDGVDITDASVGGGSAEIEEVTGDLFVKVSEYKSVTYIIDSNCDCDTSVEKVPVSYSYTNKLVPHYGYEFDNVIVMMKGINVTDEVFDANTGDINIQEVDGDITISTTVRLKTYNITSTLISSNNSNSNTRITHGDSYTAIITPEDHYALTKVYVEMDGEILYDSTWDELEEVKSFNINIPQAVEDINIQVESKYVIVVTTNLSKASSNNSQTKYRIGDSYNATYTTDQYCDFTEYSSSVGSWSAPLLNDDRTRITSINIPSLSDDVTITVSAERVQYTITNSLIETTTNNSITNIYEGEDYNAILTPSQYFEFKNVNVTMGDSDMNSSFNDGNITITKVIGNIVINVESTRIVVNVTNNLTGITTNNNATTALMGLDYYELLNIDYNNYDDINITVTMNGEVINYHNMNNGEINIPLVLGDIVVTATAITESLSQYNTLDHYTMSDIEKLKDGQKLDVILVSPRIDHGYTFGYNGEKSVNIGNGYKNLVRMQHEVAPISTDNTYVMELSKRQDTKMEDTYGPVVKTFSVSGSLYNSSIQKLNSTISGYDLYGLTSNLSISRGTTRTGTVTITFNGKAAPDTKIYAKMYASTTGGTTNITVNGQTINPTTSTSTANLSEFTAVNMNSLSLTLNLSANNNGALFAGSRNYNVYFLVPNNITEIEVTGQQEVPDGLPYFALTTKLGGVSVTDPSNLRATPDGFNIFSIDSISNSNTTSGLLPNNNPCVFKFVRISDNQLLSSGNNLGPVQFDSSESDKTIWYLYKPNTAGYSTSTVSITNRLTNATSSNAANSVMYGDSYSTTVGWDASRTPYRLSVTMCGHDITDSVYNSSTKVINIPCVIGPVIVTVACVDAEDMKKVTYTLNDVGGIINKTGYSESMSTSEYDAVLEGDEYTAQPSFEGLTTLSSKNFNMSIEPSDYKYMKVTECYADMNGQRYDDIYDVNTNTITIPEITGDCHITVSALYIVGYVDDTYYDVDKSGNHIYVEADALGSGSYTLKLTNIGEDNVSNYNNITTFSI